MIPFPADRTPADGVPFEAQLLDRLPPPWGQDLLPELGRAWADDAAPRRVVVVDDDPTGTQTVAGAGLITAWEPDDLRWLLDRPERIGFVLTNSRAMGPSAAARANHDLGTRLRAAADRRGLELDVVSRSDSTLRGHFPIELQALAAGLGQPDRRTLVVPFFAEGGRITINGTHYVGDGDRFVPAADTPFARDPSFGYTRSSLPAWIEEKTAGTTRAGDVTVIDLGLIRTGGVDGVARRLAAVEPGRYVTADAVVPADLAVVVAAVRRTEAAGIRWHHRSAAGLIAPLAGIRSADPIDPPPPAGTAGGLVVIGSHVPLSSDQLAALARRPGVRQIEVDARAIAAPTTASAELARAITTATGAIADGLLTVVHTSRTLITGDDAEASLAIAGRVASGLCRLVAAMPRPAYLVAKGGITSHTLAVDGLSARRARVLGPIVPGVPMWEMDEGTRFPGLPYVVFPGNVGGPDSLVEVVDRLESSRR
ncbi:MAG: four-carbon acid sugar kinase family protein [Actinomycetota bacterium]